jgi:large subunit ribosomal protein L30
MEEKNENKVEKMEKIDVAEAPKEENKIKSDNDKTETGLTAVVRISGMVKVRKDFANTLDRMRLRRKYACILIDLKNKNTQGMLEKIKYFVSYGNLSKETLIKLINERGKSIEGNKKEIKIDANKVMEGLMNGKRLEDFGLKPFFRLHPPRKGIDTKRQYPKGVLGKNKDIDKLIESML